MIDHKSCKLDKTRTRKLKIFGELNTSYFLWSNATNIVSDENSDINFTGKSLFWANTVLCCTNFIQQDSGLNFHFIYFPKVNVLVLSLINIAF